MNERQIMAQAGQNASAGLCHSASADLGDLVGLQRQLPARVGQAIVDRGLGVAGAVLTVHWLQVEVAEVQMLYLLRQ